MEFIICSDYDELSEKAADIFAETVKADPKCTLGLATGSTPVGTYKRLVERFRNGELDFSGVTTYAGAQNPSYMRKPQLEEFKDFNNIKMVTLASELEGSESFIENCGVHISLGHTACDYDTAMKAFAAGADCLTHTFNAMKPIHHRAPGMIPAAADAGAYAQVICDGVHIHPSVIRMLYKLFGADKMILISDSMPAAGLPDGEYTLGGDRVTVTDGIARTPDGALAGSTSFLLDCVKQAVKFGIPFDDAVKMATETPAKYLGEKLGKIEVGYPADFLVFDESFNLTSTIINGEIFR